MNKLQKKKKSARGFHFSLKYIQWIQNCPKPTTKKQLREVLGLAGYCRLWVPNFSSGASLLYELTKTTTPEPPSWEDKHKQAPTDLKTALQNPPALGLPNYDKSLTVVVQERNNQALGMLTQDCSGRMRPAEYYRRPPNSVTRVDPNQLKGVAAATQLIEASADLTLGNVFIFQHLLLLF